MNILNSVGHLINNSKLQNLEITNILINTTDISLNTVNINFLNSSNVRSLSVDVINQSGFLNNQVFNSPFTNNKVIVSGLSPSTSYNFILTPRNINNVSGKSYYFTGTASTTSSNTPITNYNVLLKPITTTTFLFNSIPNLVLAFPIDG